jgi:hypothetical protein
MNSGVPIRNSRNSNSNPKRFNPFATGCLGILGLLTISSIVGQCSNYNIQKKEEIAQKKKEETTKWASEEKRKAQIKWTEKEKQDKINADRSNYAQAVKYHKAHNFDNALSHLYIISKDYPGYSEVKKLIAINQYNKRKIESAIKMAIRKIYAEKLEQAFLDQGADTNVTVYGSNYDRIKIKYILSSRVFANQFGQSTLCTQIGEMGFKHIEIYGGLDDMRWTFDFK